jgi:hypothetical protein
LFKRSLDFVMNSMIGLGQALLKLDGVGVDALVIGFVVIGLLQIRARMDESVENASTLNYGYS